MDTLVSIVLGAITAGFVGWIDALVTYYLSLNPASISLFFILPIGAALVGFAGALGVSIGPVILGRSGSGITLLLGLMAGILTLYFSYWFQYIMTLSDQDGEVIGFGDYLGRLLANSTHVVHWVAHHVRGHAEIPNLGSVEYILAGIKVIGSGIGGALGGAVSIKTAPNVQARPTARR